MMRRVLIALFAVAMSTTAFAPVPAEAQTQSRRQDPSGQGSDGAQSGRTTPRIAPLRRQPNAGPCPYVKILYDAARYMEFAGPVAAANVGYTGEIEGLSSGCAYRDDQPIRVDVDVLFHLGRGPQAQGTGRTYRYWIAVTERDSAVLAKEYFDLPVTFDSGADRTYAVARQTLVIPRSSVTVSGENFEVLIGFDVTPEMAEFNRTGSRFRINAGPTPAPAAQ